MLSDAGGAHARRRRDTSFSLHFHRTIFFCLVRLPFIFLSFKAFSLLPSSHRDLKCCDRERSWLPASLTLTKPLLTSLLSMSPTEESLESNWFLSFQSEICLCYSHKSNYGSSYLRRIFAKFPNAPSASESLSNSFSSPPLWSVITVQTPTHDAYPYIDGAITSFSPTEETLGFCLLGLSPCCGPLIFSRPTSKCCSPTLIFKRPRFVSSTFSPNPISLMCYCYGSNRRGLCSYHDGASLNWLCGNFLQTLLLSLHLVAFEKILSLESLCTLVNCKSLSTSSLHQSFWPIGMMYLDSRYVNRLKNNGIMISSLRRGDYQQFFNPFSPLPFNTESEYELPNVFKVDIDDFKSLRNYGIMIPSPWNGGYQRFLNFLSPTPLDDKTSLPFLLADEQIQLALLVPARTSAMEPYSTSLSLSTVTIASSTASSVDDSSTNRVITCTNLLHSFGLQALMDPLSNCVCYLCVAFILAFVCWCYFVLSLSIFVSLATLNLVSFR